MGHLTLQMSEQDRFLSDWELSESYLNARGKKSKHPFMGLSRHMSLSILLLSQLLIIMGNNDSDENNNAFNCTYQSEFVLTLGHQNPIKFVF